MLRGPVPVRLHLQVERLEQGLVFMLVEGDLTDARGRVTVVQSEGGATVTWDLSLSSPVPVPAPLWLELEREVLPRWISALAQAAGRPVHHPA
ncbi:MAG: hypothetical protein ACI8PZ_005323 [Myxococcota bacterium]